MSRDSATEKRSKNAVRAARRRNRQRIDAERAVLRRPKLIRYAEDGKVAIESNFAENAIRPFTLGRRYWLFADTVSGAKASAHLYSLVQTAQANELEPYTYLRRLFAELPTAQTVKQIEALRPFNVVLAAPAR